VTAITGIHPNIRLPMAGTGERKDNYVTVDRNRLEGRHGLFNLRVKYSRGEEKK